jgi:hypothetical protein
VVLELGLALALALELELELDLELTLALAPTALGNRDVEHMTQTARTQYTQQT